MRGISVCEHTLLDQVQPGWQLTGDSAFEGWHGVSISLGAGSGGMPSSHKIRLASLHIMVSHLKHCNINIAFMVHLKYKGCSHLHLRVREVTSAQGR